MAGMQPPLLRGESTFRRNTTAHTGPDKWRIKNFLQRHRKRCNPICV